jgi:hypothetical protein
MLGIAKGLEEMTGTAVNIDPSEDTSPEKLTSALKGVLEYITPFIESMPDAKWRAHCPSDIIFDGSYDDAWQAGQVNGEAYTARRIFQLLSDTLNN